MECNEERIRGEGECNEERIWGEGEYDVGYCMWACLR
jgi:hypothetical protein